MATATAAPPGEVLYVMADSIAVRAGPGVEFEAVGF